MNNDNSARQHLNKMLPLILVGLVILALLLAVLFIEKDHKNTSQNTNAGNVWLTYTNKDNDFQLMYPPDWHNPVFIASNLNKNKHYSLHFIKTSSNQKGVDITLSMDSSNAANNICNASKECFDPGAVTKANVEDVLKNGKSIIAASDASSYAMITSLANKKAELLTVVRIVSLNTTNISAATLTYEVTGATNCPESKFADSSSTECIKRIDYDTANKVLISLKNLN